MDEGLHFFGGQKRGQQERVKGKTIRKGQKKTTSRKGQRGGKNCGTRRNIGQNGRGPVRKLWAADGFWAAGKKKNSGCTKAVVGGLGRCPKLRGEGNGASSYPISGRYRRKEREK